LGGGLRNVSEVSLKPNPSGHGQSEKTAHLIGGSRINAAIDALSPIGAAEANEEIVVQNWQHLQRLQH
jgi:hypothetical protein